MTKQTIILIHGFRGTHHGLALIEKDLQQYTTITPDLPGFGEGDTLPTYTLDAYVEWLKIFIQKQKLPTPPVLLGHSFGSILVSAYAKKYPEKISQLILVNPIGAPALEGPRSLWSKLAVFYYWVGTKLPATLAHQWLASKLIVKVTSVMMTKTKEKNLRAFIHDQHLRYFSLFHSPNSLAEGFNVSVSNSIRDFAPYIHTPTLMIAGAQDDITPLEKQKELVELFSNGTLKIIENVGHLTHYETPDQVATYVQEFITSS